MEDPVLNRSLRETRELHQRWSQFHDICVMAMKAGKSTTPAELKFLELKSQIAMLHDGFMERLDHDQKTGQNLMNILADSITLSRVANYTNAERQKFQFDWNEIFLLLTEQIGTLEDEQTRLSKVSKRAHSTARRKEQMQVQIQAFFQSIYLKIVLGLAGLIFVFWGVPTFGIYDYGKLYETPLKPLYLFYTNQFHRVVISSDYAYHDFQEIQPRDTNPAEHERIDRNRDGESDLTVDYFINTAMFEIGFLREQMDEAGKLVRTARFDRERYTADNQDVRLFWLLFPATDGAKRFVEMAVEGVEKQPSGQRGNIRNRCYVQRKANLVVVGLSAHVLRYDHPNDKWKLKKTSNLLAP